MVLFGHKSLNIMKREKVAKANVHQFDMEEK
jgi:hypothetical protein